MEERLKKLQASINKTALSVGRNPKEITLVAVTKTFPIEIWKDSLNANITTFGENRVQEAQEKLIKFKEREKIELHLIGHLQSNKVRKAVETFDVIQTIDSIKLADKVNNICKKIDKKQNIYLQINTGGDPQKHGVSIEESIKVAIKISKMENLSFRGIMTIPQKKLNSQELSLIYRTTRKIRDNIYRDINNCCQYISMGMSNDYIIAILEGATHIRIGRGLFGDRV